MDVIAVTIRQIHLDQPRLRYLIEQEQDALEDLLNKEDGHRDPEGCNNTTLRR